MASIESVTLDVADPTAADHFYTAVFGLGTQVRLRASESPTTGFRGFTLSLTVSQPATVNGLIGAALDAGATPLKPAAKSFWGYGSVVRAPDGTIWKVATSAKKDIALSRAAQHNCTTAITWDRPSRRPGRGRSPRARPRHGARHRLRHDVRSCV